MKNKKEQTFGIHLKASATIEASVIVPLTILIIAAVMTVVLVLHDRVIFPAVSLSGVMEQAGKEADIEELQSSVSELLGTRLLTARDATVAAEAEEDGISVSSGGDIRIPLSAVRALVGEGNNRIDSSVRISNLDGRKALIKYKTICDGLSALSGKEEE